MALTSTSSHCEKINIMETSVELTCFELGSGKVKVKVCLQTIHALKADRLSERPAWGPPCGFIQYVTCPLAPVSAMLGMQG